MVSKRILVTGGSGFIGSHLLPAMDQFDVINYDILPPTIESPARYIKGDIFDGDLLTESLSEVDVVIHMAATHFDFQENYFQTNVEGTKSLIAAVNSRNINKIIFLSTVAVYGKISKPTSEQELPKPNMPYGQSKWEAEQLLMEWASKDLTRSLVIIRPTVVYGPNNFGNVFNLIKQIDSGFYFHIGRGDNIKSVAYVGNLVGNILQLISKSEPGIHVFNNSDSPQLSTRDLANRIAQKLERRIIISVPRRVANILAFPFELVKLITGRDFIISKSRVEKFCTPTHFLSENYPKHGVISESDTLKGLDDTIVWYKNTKWKPLRKTWLKRVTNYN